MKLSTKGQYAVMALTDIARYGMDKPVSLSDIADRQNLPLQYLEQLFSKLRRSGLVISSRGNQGGYALSQDPVSINILDVIQAVDEQIKTKRCSSHSGFSCQGKSDRCLTHNLWDGLEEQIEGYLKTVSLADVCNQTLPPSMNSEAKACA